MSLFAVEGNPGQVPKAAPSTTPDTNKTPYVSVHKHGDANIRGRLLSQFPKCELCVCVYENVAYNSSEHFELA